MNRVRTRLFAAMAAVALGASTLAALGGTAHAVSNPPSPQLTFFTTISSHHWAGTTTNASDIEGLGYVPTNPTGGASMWVADDNADRLWEIDPATGALKSSLRGGNPSTNAANTDFLTATNASSDPALSGKTCGDASLVDPTFLDATGTTQVDSANLECLSRTDDFESVIYDSSADVLYATSGNCCNPGFPPVYVDGDNNPATPPTLTSRPFHPTVWKLTRDGSGHFKPTSWQALPEGQDPTAAGWRPGVGMYYGKSTSIKYYDFATNTTQSASISGLASDIVGVDFTDASTAFVTTATPNTAPGRTTATSDSTIRKYSVSGSAGSTTFTPVTGWTFPLASVGNAADLNPDNDGMIDARDLAIVGDTFYVSDGYDSRASGDHPIYIYALTGATLPAPNFTAVQQANAGGYPVQFTSTGTPGAVSTTPATSWAWDFGDGGISNAVNPLHTYGATGKYSVTLTVTNAAGTVPVTKQVVVSPGALPPGPQWHYESLNGSGSGITNAHFGGGNTLLQYGTQLHGFYRDTTNSSLDHSWWDGQKWNYEKLDTSGGSVGQNVTSVVYNGQLQLFYADSSGTHLTHRWWDGAWHSEAFDATKNAGSGSIVAKVYGAQLQLFYANDTSHRLRHSWYDGSWHSEDLDTGTVLPSGTSVDASKYGATLQVVYKTSSNALRHSWYDAGWHSETLDGSGSGYANHTSNSVGDFAQLQSFGSQLDVLYRDASAHGLRHAWWNGSKWSFELLDGNGGNIPGHTNDSVGSYIQPIQYSGGLHVWYRDDTTGALRHAWYAGGWHVEILDGTGSANAGASSSGNTGVFTSVVLYNGQLQLTYLDPGTADRYAHSWYA